MSRADADAAVDGQQGKQDAAGHDDAELCKQASSGRALGDGSRESFDKVVKPFVRNHVFLLTFGVRVVSGERPQNSLQRVQNRCWRAPGDRRGGDGRAARSTAGGIPTPWTSLRGGSRDARAY